MPDLPPRPRRRWFRVSLRGLMVLVLIVGGGVGWLGHVIRTQRAVIKAVAQAKGKVVFDYQREFDATPRGPIARTEPAAPRWLRRYLGDELFRSIVSIQYPSLKAPPVLEALTRLDRLEDLMIHDESPPDASFASLGAVRGLRSLTLTGPGLTDAKIAQALEGLTDLQDLTVEVVRQPLAAALQGLPRYQPGLTTLRVGRAKVTDADLAAIARLPRLRLLFTTESTITDAGLVHLGNLAPLADLTLMGAKLTDEGLVHLARLPALEHLDLSSTRITDVGLVHLTRLPKLARLELANTGVTDAGLPELARIRTLTELDLGGNLAITDAGLVPSHFGPRLVGLRLDSTAVTQAGVDALNQRRPGLNFQGIQPTGPGGR